MPDDDRTGDDLRFPLARRMAQKADIQKSISPLHVTPSCPGVVPDETEVLDEGGSLSAFRVFCVFRG